MLLQSPLRSKLGWLVLVGFLILAGGFYSWHRQLGFSTSLAGPTFHYPASLGTTYITPVNWPPKLQVLSQVFTCITGEAETIKDHAYCVTKNTEGAAGSIYTTYTYMFPRNNKTAVLSFTLRAGQCDNYEEPKKTACQQEQATFDVGVLVDTMAQSVKLP